jgi:hypothetical protein
MGSKSGPPAPDYTAAAQQTAASSQQAAEQQNYANRPDQTTPYGSQTWTPTTVTDPTTGQKVTQWGSTTTLTPTEQQALNSQQGLQQSQLSNAQALSNATTASSTTPINFNSFSPYATTPTATNTSAVTNPYGFNASSINTSLQQAAPQQTSLGPVAGQTTNSIDYGNNLAPLQSGADNSSTAANAAYAQATSRLDPQWQQAASDEAAKLANAGISQNSDAYTRAMTDFNNSQTDAYNQAMNSAIQAGVSQGATQYGENLSTAQQQATQAQNQAAFGNAAQQQNYTQALDTGQFSNTANQNAFSMGNTALQSQLAAQVQQQQLGLGQEQQGFNQQLAATNQNYGQQLQSAQFQNTERGQQQSDAIQAADYPTNLINSMVNGQQVTTPSFASSAPAASGAATDYSTAAANQYQSMLDSYNASQAASGQTTSALASIASLAAMYYSDRRVKADVRRIGTHPIGVGIYSYRYIGERGTRVGVMAQEVRRVAPHLVVSNRGVLMVDYAGLEAANDDRAKGVRHAAL